MWHDDGGPLWLRGTDDSRHRLIAGGLNYPEPLAMSVGSSYEQAPVTWPLRYVLLERAR